MNGGWFEDDNHLLSRVDTIRHIPATIVQGRYDMITPMKTAWELHKVGPNLAVEMRLSLSATYCHANSRTHTHTHTLFQLWPEAEFHVVPDAGHSQLESGTLAKLMEACEKYKDL